MQSTGDSSTSATMAEAGIFFVENSVILGDFCVILSDFHDFYVFLAFFFMTLKWYYVLLSPIIVQTKIPVRNGGRRVRRGFAGEPEAGARKCHQEGWKEMKNDNYQQFHIFYMILPVPFEFGSR